MIKPTRPALPFPLTPIHLACCALAMGEVALQGHEYGESTHRERKILVFCRHIPLEIGGRGLDIYNRNMSDAVADGASGMEYITYHSILHS